MDRLGTFHVELQSGTLGAPKKQLPLHEVMKHQSSNQLRPDLPQEKLGSSWHLPGRTSKWHLGSPKKKLPLHDVTKRQSSNQLRPDLPQDKPGSSWHLPSRTSKWHLGSPKKNYHCTTSRNVKAAISPREKLGSSWHLPRRTSKWHLGSPKKTTTIARGHETSKQQSVKARSSPRKTWIVLAPST